MRVVAILLAAGLFAGCLDDSGPAAPPPEPETPAIDSEAPLLELSPSDAVNGSKSFSIKTEGRAGGWIAVHVPFLEPTGDLDFSYDYEAIVADASPGSGAFFWPLGLTRAENDGWAIGRANPFEERIITFQPNQQHWQKAGSMGSSSSSNFAGLFIAMAAEGPWTLTLTVDADTPMLPAQIARGEGAMFLHGGDALVPVPGGGPVNQVSYQTEVPAPGWTHLEIVHQRLQPNAVRQSDFSLPNGHSASGLGTMRGHYVPLVGGSAGSSGIIDYIGSLQDVAGTARAEVTYVETQLGQEFGFMHLPLAPDALPNLVLGDYSGSTWPFWDELPLPDPP